MALITVGRRPYSGGVAVAGILLAAGAGRRAGGPKALRRFEDGEAWVTRAARTLQDGGCDPVLVVVGAEADAVAALVPPGAVVVRCEGWAEGMGASLRAGLAAAGSPSPRSRSGGDGGLPDAVVVALVDMPGVTSAIVARLIEQAAPATLARAAYDGEPGHPVLIGRDHWAEAARAATGDRGARGYLTGGAVRLVESADLGSGADRDTA